MKTKVFLLLCFLMGIGLSQISAQSSKSEENRTIVSDYYADYTATIDIICDGEVIDQVSGSFYTLKARDHYKAGQFLFGNYSLNNFYFTSTTGEAFVMHGFLEKYMVAKGFDSMHFNLIGDMGHRYIIHVVYSLDPWELMEAHGMCK